MTQFLTPAEVAVQLRISRVTVNNLIRRGEISAVRIGRMWRVDETELNLYLEKSHN